ncbi:MAG: imidazole glycerol phosphate synthase subunit HisH [Oleispira sp.]
MITVIDLKVGNMGSLINALKFLNIDFEIVDSIEDFLNPEKIILPGVGSFSAASACLFESGFFDAISKEVLENNVPILGICVGMQLLAEIGYEGGESRGLGFIKADVTKISRVDESIRIPHMGWNSLESIDYPIFSDLKANDCVYFVHSYEMKLKESIAFSTVDHGGEIVAYVNKGHVHGVQFHPEKSQGPGLSIIKNFVMSC